MKAEQCNVMVVSSNINFVIVAFGGGWIGKTLCKVAGQVKLGVFVSL